MKRCLLLLLLLALPLAAHANDYPLVSAHRLQLGGGVNREWFNAEDDAPKLKIAEEFSIGLYAAYNLVPALDLVGSAKRGLDSHVWNSSVGLRITFYAGGD